MTGASEGSPGWRGRVVTVGLVAVLAVAAAVAVEALRFRRGLSEAGALLSRGESSQALERLDGLRPAFAFGRRAEYDYQRGVALWAGGQRARALVLFQRLPWPGEWARRAAFFRAEAALLDGRLDEAEARVRAVAELEPGSQPANQWLERLARLEARFDEVRVRLIERLAIAPDSTAATLRSLWTLDRGIVPLESIAPGLDQAAARAPDDPGIRLGRARLAILKGQLDQARALLDTLGDHPGVPRARLQLAAATSRAAEVLDALKSPVNPGWTRQEIHRWHAWLRRRATDAAQSDRDIAAARTAEAAALRAWLADEPRHVEALERLAELAVLQGDDAEARTLRQTKAEVDRAVLAYDQAMRSESKFTSLEDRRRMAALAEAAGRPLDAAAWSIPADPPAGGVTNSVEQAVRFALDGRARWPLLADVAVAGSLDQSERPGMPAVAFQDEAARAGVAFQFRSGRTAIHQMPEALGGGVALIDVDGDGWLDLYLPQGGDYPPGDSPRCADRFYRNQGGGRFEDASERFGLPALRGGYGQGTAVGDYDSDGDPDLLLTRWGGLQLLRNEGGTHFVDATAEAGLDRAAGWPTSAVLTDLDGDGALDLYVCHYVQWDPVNPRLCRNPRNNSYMSCSPRDVPAECDRFYRDLGGGRFEDATESSGLSAIDTDGRGLGVLAANLDGLAALGKGPERAAGLSLFVADDQTANLLLRVETAAPLRLVDAAAGAGVASNGEGGYRAGMGVACGDIDGDGLPELAVTNFYGEGTTLYRNLGDGLFADDSAAAGLAASSRYRLGFGASIADFNNDGRNDLVTANGHLDELPETPYRMPMQLLMGVGKGRLEDFTGSAGAALATPRLARGLATGDLDNDGKLDLVVVDQDAPVAVLMNRTERAGHWLVLGLEAAGSHHEAIGAVVAVGAGADRRLALRIGGGSYLSASDPRVHIGLGETAASRVEVVVAWPSGRDERFTVPVDTGSLLREGAGEPRPLPGY